MKFYKKISDDEWVEYDQEDWSGITFRNIIGYMIMVLVFSFVCVLGFCGICYFITYMYASVPITIGLVMLWYGGLRKVVKPLLYRVLEVCSDALGWFFDD